MMTESACPDCEAHRPARGRCRCGSFAAPKMIKVPDPAGRVAAWGGIPTGAAAGRATRPQDREAAVVWTYNYFPSPTGAGTVC